MIYQKLATIQREVRAVQKNADGFNYKYVNGDALLSIIRPKMDEQGLLLMPEVVDMSVTPIAYEKWDKYSKSVQNCTEVLADVRMRMTWVDSEDGETLSQMWAATGMNGFDKGFGSALTYGERYYLLKLFHLPTDRDDVDAVNVERDEAIAKARETAKPVKVSVTAKQYANMVKCQATGVKAKSGKDYRDEWIESCKPSEEEIVAFDKAVADYRNPFEQK